MIIEEILLPTTIGYCKMSDFFLWVIFLVSSPSSLTTMRFPYSSWINTSLGESSSFPVLSISIPSSFFSAITTVLEGLPFSMKPFFFFENKTRKIKQVNICKCGLLYFNAYIFVSSALAKNCNKNK